MATGFGNTTFQTSKVNYKYLGKKVNTALKIGIKQKVEEYSWLRQFPKERITVSQNENWIPLLLDQAGNVAAIPEFGYEATPSSPSPIQGTFMPVQLNKRFPFSVLAESLDQRAKQSYVENQLAYQAMQGVYALSRTIGRQFYGGSTGTIAVVAATNSAGTTQVIQMKDGYGYTIVPGVTDQSKKYLSFLIAPNEHVALVRAGAIVEFGNVTASPSASAGDGFLDVTFNASCTPTVGDAIVFANAVTDSTITGTDWNLWPVGFLGAMLDDSVEGVSRTAQPNWKPGCEITDAERMSFQVKERMKIDIFNASGNTPTKFILSQGVRINAIAGELGARRYDSSKMDLEGSLVGDEYLSSQLVPPGMCIAWVDEAYSMIELSNLPEEGGGRGMYSVDKVQDRNGFQSSLNYIYQKIVSSRAGLGYHSNLNED